MVGLLTTVNRAAQRVSIHGVRRELLQRQAERLGLPLFEVPLPSPCPNSAYELRIGQALTTAAAQGVQGVAFGDLLLEDVREYREQQLGTAGLQGVFPIFGRSTAEVAEQEIAVGIASILSCVDPRKLTPDFAGRRFDHGLLAELRSLPQAVDPCGENGEFHTFTFDSPDYRSPIPVTVGAVVERDGFIFADLLGVPETVAGP